jgi:hypothetical protein
VSSIPITGIMPPDARFAVAQAILMRGEQDSCALAQSRGAAFSLMSLAVSPRGFGLAAGICETGVRSDAAITQMISTAYGLWRKAGYHLGYHGALLHGISVKPDTRLGTPEKAS